MTNQQFQQKIASRLIEARKMKKFSTLELAQAIKVSTYTIVKIESATQRNINFYTIYKICEVLDLDLDFFID
jgi:transcriptional regulator with XRE-family HTH domain